MFDSIGLYLEQFTHVLTRLLARSSDSPPIQQEKMSPISGVEED